jgi:membrane protease subunit HflK
VVPRAVGAASRLKEEADAYRERIVAQAEGDAQRFKTILPEYQKSPQVMRDRLYTDTMQQIYSNVTKVLVDSKQGSNMLYLPLDKIMQQVTQVSPPAMDTPAPSTTGSAASSSSVDARARDLQRSRERDPR